MNILLNRIGIILNFLAGFLIAPELIGIKRIKRWESLIENRLTTMKKQSEEIIERLAVYYRVYLIYDGKDLVSNIFGIGLIVISLFLVRDKGYIDFINSGNEKVYIRLLVGGFFILMGIIDIWETILFFKLKYYWIFILSLSTKLISVGGIIMLINIFDGIVFLLYSIIIISSINTIQNGFIWLIPRLIEGIRFTTSIFKKGDELQSYLVTIGIVLFILGSIFQLIATF